MDDETRRDVDGACLRLMGYEHHGVLPDLWFGKRDSVVVGKDGPSQNADMVVPLAEALRALGYSVCIFAIRDQWEVTVCHGETWKRAMVDAPTAAEALAVAAARAMKGDLE